MIYHGVIPVFKPKGYTSHDIVAIIRRTIGQKRVGHTGTLDPDVEGVLPVCLGKATRVVEYIQDFPKRYKGSLVLGVATDTQDQSGRMVAQSSVKKVDRDQLEEVFEQFTGIIEQIPPMYSAVKVDGKRLYESARKGEIVKRASRKVRIYELTCLAVQDDEFPIIEFNVQCSKGTYVRTLCVDIGKALGYPAHMSSLIRTESGPFYLEDCFTLEEIKDLVEQDKLVEELTKIDEVLGNFPGIIVSNDEEKFIRNGCAITSEEDVLLEGLFRVYVESGRFCALYYWDKEIGLGQPKKVFWDVES